MKELIKDIIETSRDRIKTPITSSFAIAFLIYNWRPLIILLFSNSSVEDKIIKIDEKYCDIWALLFPLLIAVIYVVLVPYIMMGLEYCTKKAIKGRKKHKANLTISDLDNYIIVAGKQFELEQVKSGQRDISELNERINELNNQIETQNNQHRTQIDNLNHQHQAQVDTFQELIESYKVNDGKTKSQIKDYEKLIADYRLNNENIDDKVQHLKSVIEYNDTKLNAIIIASGFKDVFDNLNPEEKEYYVDFCERIYHSSFNKDGFIINTESVAKFIDLNLIDFNESGINRYKIKPLGVSIYDYLKKIPYDF